MRKVVPTARGCGAIVSNQKVEVPEIRGYRTKRLRLFLPLKALSRGATTGVGLAIDSYLGNQNELLWLVIRRRRQQHAVNEVENCGGRPMPSASVSTATTVKPGFLLNTRKANRRSGENDGII